MKAIVPNLFIIGAMKSGTTSLHEYLDEHPEIFMSPVKEPGFFADCVDYYPSDLKWYLSLFKDVKEEKIIGESSTHYTKLPLCTDVAEKIKSFSPDARFIYIMRNPIERAVSHYWHDVKSGMENRDICTAIKKNGKYIAFSDYAFQLKPYFERFGRKNIYTMTFEDLIHDPDKSIKEVLEWLGVDSAYKSTRLGSVHNKLPSTFRKVKGLGLLYRFRDTVLWNSIAYLVPNSIRSIAANFTVEEISKSENHLEEVKAYLQPILVEKVSELEMLLGKKYDCWKL